MSDTYVKNTQHWLNENYSSVPGWGDDYHYDGGVFYGLQEDGAVGWETIYGLIKALQHELGITALADNFGDGTMAALTEYGNISADTTNPNIINILIGGLYCKGYDVGDGGELPGRWSTSTGAAVRNLQNDMGIPQADYVTPKMFKAILSMDAYTLLSGGPNYIGGTSYIREAQQWMNATYIDQPWFSIIPADGLYSRNVQQAMIWAIQTNLDVPGANGNFGPGTQTAMRSHDPIQVGDEDYPDTHWIRLFQAAMRFNQYETDFTGVYSAKDRDLVQAFQYFSQLPPTGQGDYQTWCSLLVSCGDATRKGSAIDCSQTVTPARAQALAQDGRLFVGRYLTDAPEREGYYPPIPKKIKPGELQTIFDAGMRVFPIFETWGIEADYFTRQQGVIDGEEAVKAAAAYGFKVGTTIYFAVDYDAYGTDISTTGLELEKGIIPYFGGVRNAIGVEYAHQYDIGVYATRNVCSQLASTELTKYSFLADMSTGFSGNLGFPMPDNWAFDQISTYKVGSGDGEIEIDNDLCSLRDQGQDAVDPIPLDDSEHEPSGWVNGTPFRPEVIDPAAVYFTQDCNCILNFATGQTGALASATNVIGRDGTQWTPEMTTIIQGKGYVRGETGWWPADYLATACNNEPLVIQTGMGSNQPEVCFWIERLQYATQSGVIYAGPGYSQVLTPYLQYDGGQNMYIAPSQE